MTPELALSLLAVVGGFIGSVAITMVSVGRRDQKIETIDKEVATMRTKVDAIGTTCTEHGRDLHAAKNAQQQQEFRHQNAVDRMDATIGQIHGEIQSLALAMARVEAAIKRE